MTNFSFLAVGKTGESKEAVVFKKYVGVAASKVIAVNPTKAELEKIYGTDNINEPEYLKEDDNGKAALITFVVKTDPDQDRKSVV